MQLVIWSVEKVRLHVKRWRTTLGQRVVLVCFLFLLQMIEDLFDHHRIFNPDNDAYGRSSVTVAGMRGSDNFHSAVTITTRLNFA
jgi:hypothetical protein